MGGKSLNFLQKLCLFSRNTAEKPNESSTLLPKSADGQQEHSLETGQSFQYYTHNTDDIANKDETSQSGTPEERFLLFRYRPDPFIPFIKYFMFCFNSVFFTLGLAILCIGFWGFSTKQSLVGEQIGYLGTDPMLAFVLIGLMTCTLSFTGCVGFIRENTCLLKTFFIGITVLIVTQCLVAIVFLCFQQQIQDSLKNTMLVAMSRYQDDSDLKFILDEIQLAMECCGAQSYQDWYFNCTSPGVNSCGVPYSCCIDPLQNGTVPNFQCGFGTLEMGELAASSVVYLGGCIPQLVIWVSNRIWDIVAIYILLATIEIVCLVFAQRVMREIKLIKSLY
ncbi:tetraspanin-10 isoform 2-T2 [Mantella aurantiaca]